MKYKGKIIQIIEEKQAKKFVLDWQQNVIPNHDYLNIRPKEERETTLKFTAPLYICLGIVLACLLISYFLDYNLSGFISFIGMFLLIIIGNGKIKKYQFKNVPKGIWYFDSPFAVEKPHDYKVGDLVEIELNLRKEK